MSRLSAFFSRATSESHDLGSRTLEKGTMKNPLLLLGLLPLAVGCIGTKDNIDNAYSCEKMTEESSDEGSFPAFYEGAFADPTATEGAYCMCTMDFRSEDRLLISLFEAGGESSLLGFKQPMFHQLLIAEWLYTETMTPSSGIGSEYGWDWYSSFPEVESGVPSAYDGTWTTFLSIVTADGNEIQSLGLGGFSGLMTDERCEENYSTGYYFEFDSRTATSGGGTAWSVEEDSEWEGSITFFFHPDQPLRGDGLLHSFPILQSGKPTINGAEITQLSVTDSGTATGIEIDGVYHSLGDKMSLKEPLHFDSRVFVDYGDSDDIIPPTLEVSGVLRGGATKAPTEGYAIPSYIMKALGYSQPLVVQLIDDSIMLTAIGSGMSRGTALDDNGYFDRAEGPEGFAISGRAVQTKDGLVLSELSASLEGWSLPTLDEVTLKSISE